MSSETRPSSDQPAKASDPPVEAPPATPRISPDGATATGGGVVGTIEDQLALRQLIWEYLIPVETNTFWYTLGGVLAIALTLEIVTGVLLSFKYRPDAAVAFALTSSMINSTFWHVIINFHYFNAFLIFGLVMVHMMRVFISGGYRRGKQGLWLIGVGLAGLTFLLSLTGEALHWDEVGFAVPWHISEFFQAIGLADNFHYTFAALKAVPSASGKLSQIYAIHIALAPILLLLFIVMHYYLIKVKGISLPFWIKASGRTAPFSKHIREWLIYSAVILGAVLLLSMFVPRGTGTAPQLLPESPYYGSTHGPGKLGAKPSYPISWTHGMNVFFGEHLGIEPDIWGTVVGITLMTLALLVVPFVDRARREPEGSHQAFDWRQRGWAFAAIAVFWIVMIVGVVQNAIAGTG